jgi:MFS family permease
MMDRIDDYYGFIILSFVTRLLHGVGSAITATLVYSIVAFQSTEENINTNMGYMELAYSIGVTIGPLVASALYYFGGYSMPFYFCSILFLICLFYLHRIIIDEEQCEDHEFFKILFKPVLIIYNYILNLGNSFYCHCLSSRHDLYNIYLSSFCKSFKH